MEWPRHTVVQLHLTLYRLHQHLKQVAMVTRHSVTMVTPVNRYKLYHIWAHVNKYLDIAKNDKSVLHSLSRSPFEH